MDCSIRIKKELSVWASELLEEGLPIAVKALILVKNDIV